MEILYELYAAKLKEIKLNFVRYLHEKINWNSRIVVVVGARGIGKTTMVLQHILLTKQQEHSLYVGADNTYFASHTLFDVASEFSKNGGKVLYIDEAHKYEDWSREVKMMYDYIPDLQIIITGSSILDIIKGTDADLSRRAICYTLQGMSFREYLNFSYGQSLKAITLEEVIEGKYIFPKGLKPIALFKEYLSKGYYPFFRQDDYYTRLENTINLSLEVDIPTYAKINIGNTIKLKKLLKAISRSVPFKPNMTELGRATESDRATVANYMFYMNKAGLIRQLVIADDGMSLVEKIDKIYLANTTLIYALAEEKPEIGNVRETFFLSAMSVGYKVKASPVSDFVINNYTFEIGGKSKNQKQIKELSKAYIVKDDIENPYMNIIPLWAFGLCY